MYHDECKKLRDRLRFVYASLEEVTFTKKAAMAFRGELWGDLCNSIKPPVDRAARVEFGGRVRAARKRLEKRQADLAVIAKTTERRIGHIEKGERPATPTERAHLENWLAMVETEPVPDVPDTADLPVAEGPVWTPATAP